jgi:hypothetical protein
MARRHEDWNIGLAEDLRDPAFAREFLLGAMDEEVPLQVALGKVARAMGVKEFAQGGDGEPEPPQDAQPSPQSHAGHAESASEAVSAQAKLGADPGPTEASPRSVGTL